MRRWLFSESPAITPRTFSNKSLFHFRSHHRVRTQSILATLLPAVVEQPHGSHFCILPNGFLPVYTGFDIPDILYGMQVSQVSSFILEVLELIHMICHIMLLICNWFAYNLLVNWECRQKIGKGPRQQIGLGVNLGFRIWVRISTGVRVRAQD